MSFTDVFGGSTIYPNDVSYLALALDADTTLEWPLNESGDIVPAARIIGVTASDDYTITLPAANQTGPGQTILFDNLPASASQFFVVDADGGAVATVGTGTQWQVYLADNSDAAGTWQVFQMGASTATVQPTDLAGPGLTVISNQLAQSQTVVEFNTTPRTLLITDRGSVLVWTGTGAGTLNLLAAATAGNNYFIAVRNSGGGDFTIDPSGSETVDDASTLVLAPGDSATLVTNGLEWYTIGLGQQAVFAFDYTVIDITGVSDPYTLSGSELNRIAYNFTGTLTHDLDIVVPDTIQQYWVDNDTTGSFALAVRTSAGTPYTVAQGTRVILYCNGSEVVNANSASGGLTPPVAAADGGTGQTSYTVGDLLYASGVTSLSKLSDVSTGNVLLSGGVGIAPAYGKVGLTTHISGTLAVANGGTNLTSYTVGDIVYASGATTLAKLADVATGNVLKSGGVGVAPTYGKVDLTADVSGLLPMANGGLAVALVDPGADRILFWDDSAGNYAYLTAGTNLTISGTTLDAAFTNPIDTQVFTSSGTWTKPASATVVMVEVWGAGGGGASGRRGAAGTWRYGGGGGGGGYYARKMFNAADLSATETVTIAAGGAGGAAVGTDNTDGSDGSPGGNSSFGTKLTAHGGTFGLGGTATGSTGGQGAGAFYGGETGSGGNSASATNVDGPLGGVTGGTTYGAFGTFTGGGGGASSGEGGGSLYGGAGGGGGAYINTANTNSGASAGGRQTQGLGGGTGGVAFNGGQGNITAGSAGGIAGGGGGGGGQLNGTGGNSGGSGGNGYCRVTTWG